MIGRFAIVPLALTTLTSVGLTACTRRGGSEEVGAASGPVAPAKAKGPSNPTAIVPANDDPVEAAPTLAEKHLRTRTVETSPRRHAFRLHALAGGVLVSHGLRVAVLGEGGGPPPWTDVPWPEAPPADPIYGGGEVDLVGGAWPDQTFAVLSDVRPRVAALRNHVRWSAQRWVSWNPRPSAGGVFVTLVSWRSGHVLALQHVDMWSSPDEPPEPEIVVLGERPPAAFTVPDGVRPVALWASGTGDVYAVAAGDPEESTSPSARYEGPAYALRWSVDGGDTEALYALPERNGLRPQAGDVRLIFEIDGVVHVGGGVGDDAAEMFTPYLAREGDEGWTLAPLPDRMKGMLAAVAPARDASSFFTTSEEMGPGNGARWVAGRGDMAGTGSLWQRLGDGRWRRVKVELDRQPKDASSGWIFAPQGVAIADDTLWIAAGVAGHHALSSEDTGHVLGHAKVPD